MDSLEQAKSFHQKGQWQQAQEHYLALLDEDPKHIDALIGLAILQAQLGQSDKALTLAKQAMSIAPQNIEALLTLANLYVRTKQFDSAITTLTDAIAIKPELKDAHFNLANIFYTKQQYEKAILHYKQCLNDKRYHNNALLQLGASTLALTQFDTAQDFLNQLIAVDAKHPQAHGYLGQIHLQAKRYNEAISHFKQRILYQQDHAPTHHDLGLCFISLKNYQRALFHLNTSYELDPKQCDIVFHLGVCSIELGQFEKALSFFLKQIEIKPDIDSYYNIAVLLMYAGRRKEALDYFLHVLTLEPNHYDSHVNLGVLYLNNNDKTQAITHYQKALQLQPNNAEIQHILSAMQQHQIQKQAPEAYVSHLFDQYAPYYDIHLEQQLKYAVPQAINTMLEHINVDFSDAAILDLGCGSGLVASHIILNYKHIDGLDASSKMLQVAGHKNIYKKLVHGMIDPAIKELGLYRVIIAADVFTYIGELDKTLALIYQHLEPLGYLCFSVETSHKHSDYELKDSIRYGHNPEHLNTLAQQHGFKIIEMNNLILREQNQDHIEGMLCLWQKDRSSH